uniref:C2H2-type domain-containing protein n=1 Tax=Steinernema glaseri TaxID=37863 RepID=A0A1I8A1E6_9BILA
MARPSRALLALVTVDRTVLVALPAADPESSMEVSGVSTSDNPFSSNRNHFGFLTTTPSTPNHQFLQLKCCECGIEKPGCEELEIHIKIEHLNWLPFVCPICQTTRATNSLLREHIYSAHKKSNTSKFVYMDNPKAQQQLLIHLDNSLNAYCTRRMTLQNGNGVAKSNGVLFPDASSTDVSNPRKRKPPKPVVNNETGELIFPEEGAQVENGFSDLAVDGVDAESFGVLANMFPCKKETESEGEMDMTVDDTEFKANSFLNDISQLFQGDKTAIDVLVHPSSTPGTGQKRRVMNPKGSQKGGTSKKRVLGLCSRCQKPVTAGGRQMHVFFHMGKDEQTYRFRCNFPDCDAEHYRKDQMEAHMVKMHGGIRADLIEDRAPELNERAQLLSMELLGTSTNAPGPSAEVAQRIYDQQVQEQTDKDEARARKRPKVSAPEAPKGTSPEQADPDDEEHASTSVVVKREEPESGDRIECQQCKKPLMNRIRGFHILWHMARDLGICRYACKYCKFHHDRSQAVHRHLRVEHSDMVVDEDDTSGVIDTINQHQDEIKMMSQKCFGIDALFARDASKKGGKFAMLSNGSSKENCLEGLEDFSENAEFAPGANDLDRDVVIDEETGDEPASESGNSESQNDSDGED